MNDLRLAIRTLARNGGFSAVAVLMLALGIGFSAASFSLTNAFLLRNVPYPDADRLVRIFATSQQTESGGHAPGNILDVADAVTSFSSFVTYNGDLYSVGEPGQPPEQVQGMAVSPNFFEMLGMQPFLGRGFTQDDIKDEQPTVAILTHHSWTRHYAADRDIVGRTIRINAAPHTVVGVMPAMFEAPLVWGTCDVIIPRTVPSTFHTNRRDTWMQAAGRLKPGVSIRQAQAELSTIAARLEQEYPNENKGRGLRVVGLAQSNMDTVSRSLLWLMTGIAVAMLLIACANLASLQVARAFVRGREFTVRAALGGSRWHLMAPLLTESMVLAFAGGVASLLVASWTNDILGSMLLINNEPGFEIPLDGRVFGFAAVSTLVSGLAFGLAPAWMAGRSPAAEALKEGSRSSTGGRSHQRLKHTLIVCELATALTLVAVAAAFGIGAETFVKRQVGWEMDGLFTANLALPYTPYGDDERSAEFYRLLEQKLAAIPGVEHAAISRNLPMYSLGPSEAVAIEGQPAEEVSRRPIAQIGAVTTDYFKALRIPLREGMFFPPDLQAGDPPLTIINQSFAERFWPGESAVGRHIQLGDSDQWIEVCGVVGDVGMLTRFNALDTQLQAYRPVVQNLSRYMGIVLRTSVVPESVTKSVREAVASLDADLPIAHPGSLRAAFERGMTNLNLVVVNLAISAGMGLLIAAIGLYGVISQLTAQRTRDIGVRMALGAGRGDILRMVLNQGARLFVIGVVLGVPAYYGVTTLLQRAMPSMILPGVWLLGTVIAVLSVTMFFATWRPAMKATRISPVEALRAD